MRGFNHYLEATLTPGRNRVLKKKGISIRIYYGISTAFPIRSVDHSLSIRLMVSLRVNYLKNEPFSGLFSKNIWLVLGAGAVRNHTYRERRSRPPYSHQTYPLFSEQPAIVESPRSSRTARVAYPSPKISRDILQPAPNRDAAALRRNGESSRI